MAPMTWELECGITAGFLYAGCMLESRQSVPIAVRMLEFTLLFVPVARLVQLQLTSSSMYLSSVWLKLGVYLALLVCIRVFPRRSRPMPFLGSSTFRIIMLLFLAIGNIRVLQNLLLV